jgi:hypothetical protein
MGNLKSNKTKEEWDDLVDKSESHSDQVIGKMNIDKFIEEAAERLYLSYENNELLYGHSEDLQLAYKAGIFDGAKWMMKNIEINLRRVK